MDASTQTIQGKIMRWFIADTHFNHANVIVYDKRPFKDVIEMENEIVRRWNSSIKHDDVVYHLGDFAFGSVQLQQEILSKLNGQKILIRGNHDGSENRCKKSGWHFVCDGILLALGGFTVCLSHDPSVVPKDFMLLHGHTHKHSDRPNGICVSCNLWNYSPVSEKTIINKLKGVKK